MNFGAVDIGSNAVRLLIARVLPDSEGDVIQKVAFLRVPIRLGSDVFVKGKVSKKKKLHLAQTINAYNELLDVYNVKAFRICATSAMREAANRKEVVAFVEGRSGLRIEVIDGNQEAALLFSTFFAHRLKKDQNYLYIDVGGGSMEVTLIVNGKPKLSKSFNVGTIRMLKDMVKDGTWDDLDEWTEKIKPYGPMTAIGTGGNINKITKMMALHEKKEVTYKQLCDFKTYLESFSVEERVDRLGLRPDRADVIVPAAHLYTTVMRKTGVEIMQVPKAGLSDGIIQHLYNNYQPED